MKCDSCGRENLEYANYCASCGNKLTAFAQKKKPDKTAKTGKPKSKRLLYLVLISVFLLITDLFLSSPISNIAINDELVEYDCDEFSIKMASGFIPSSVKESKIENVLYYGGQHIKFYTYTGGEGEIVTACIAKDCSSDFLSCAENNRGSFSSNILFTLYAPEDLVIPYVSDFKDEMVQEIYQTQFIDKDNMCFDIKCIGNQIMEDDPDLSHLFTSTEYDYKCREIIKDGCIYSFCIKSSHSANAYKWLESIEIKSDG